MPDISLGLDILAGEASRQIELGKQIKRNQLEREQAIAIRKTEFDATHAIDSAQLKLARQAHRRLEKKDKKDDLLKIEEQNLKETKETNDTLIDTGQLVNSRLSALEDFRSQSMTIGSWTAEQEEGYQEEKKRYDFIFKELGVPDFDVDINEEEFEASQPAPTESSAFKDAFDAARGRTAAQQIGKFENIFPMLDVVEELFVGLDPASGGIEAKFRQYLKSGAASIGLFPKGKGYKDVVSGMAVQTARALGDVGNIAVAERIINEKMLPRVTDTKEEGLEKLRIFKKFVTAIHKRQLGVVKSMMGNSGYGDTSGITLNPIGADAVSSIIDISTQTAPTDSSNIVIPDSTREKSWIDRYNESRR